ncbi:hypothetical protein L1987_02608 [Smallanthus sonchifolius]|uniref:Uncharacterized protein n=1 Tax=Smallanthus sonchifolius TaxID=185202 RepID=A0ACB9K8C1_9ASTR|nr:hypothetical protein L1987_02608 [Smallanthus sonchifolius]
MRTRSSGRTSPLVFEPEIERIARQNRIQQQNLQPISSEPSSMDGRSSHSGTSIRNRGPTPNRGPIPNRPPTPHHRTATQTPPIPINNNQPRGSGPVQQNRPVNIRTNPTYQGRRGPQQNQTPPGNNENEGWEDEDGEYFGYADNEDVGNGEGFGDYEYEDGERSIYGEYNEGQGFEEEEEVNYVHQRARQPMGRTVRPERFGYPPRQEGRRATGGYNNEKRRQPVAPMGGVNGHFRPAISENASPFVPPIPGMRRFKLRPNYINVLPHFHGMVTEEPYTHLSEFAAICSTIGDENFDQSEVKLRLFQFSLKDRAKQWFITLPANSIHTWDEMQQVFLDEYYSVAKTDDSRIEIRTFQQQTGEPLHEAFTRFKELLRKCPHHQIELWELVKCFVDGLTQEERKYLKSTSNGTLLSNPEEDDWDFL